LSRIPRCGTSRRIFSRRLETASTEEAELTQLLKDLVSIDSVNPCLCPSHRGEREIADFVAEKLKAIGMQVRLQQVVGERRNVIGSLAGKEKGKRLLVVAHLDTVGTDTMTIPPFSPTVVGNKLHGRGSSDTKAGLAAAIKAIEWFAAEARELKGEIVFAGTVDEEYEARGVEEVVKEMEADGAIVMEPVGLKAVIAHKGYAWQEFQIFGKAAHGSDVSKGVDAIMHASTLLEELQVLNEKLSRKTHPLLGSGSLHASQIEGGEGWSTYPALCTLRVERRTLPGETKKKVRGDFLAIVERLHEGGIDARTEMHFFRPATEISPDEEVVRVLRRSALDNGIECPIAGMPAWPEAGVLNLAGIPSVVFGPKGCPGHEADESVELDSVVLCANILRRTFDTYLS